VGGRGGGGPKALRTRPNAHLARSTQYYGGGQQTKYSPGNKPLPYEFVTLYLRGGTDGFALKGGDATRGVLTTMWNGERPLCSIAGTCMRHGNHVGRRARVHAALACARVSSARALIPSPPTPTQTYQPMSKKGAIILGTGGDNSNGAIGRFYEGVRRGLLREGPLLPFLTPLPPPPPPSSRRLRSSCEASRRMPWTSRFSATLFPSDTRRRPNEGPSYSVVRCRGHACGQWYQFTTGVTYLCQCRHAPAALGRLQASLYYSHRRFLAPCVKPSEEG
jgi:hypothetical protein